MWRVDSGQKHSTIELLLFEETKNYIGVKALLRF